MRKVAVRVMADCASKEAGVFIIGGGIRTAAVGRPEVKRPDWKIRSCDVALHGGFDAGVSCLP